jgi:hypothetical protein
MLCVKIAWYRGNARELTPVEIRPLLLGAIS